MNNKSKNTEYSLLSNIIYSHKSIYLCKASYIITIIFTSILSLIGVAISTYTPSIIIGAVESKCDIESVFIIVFGVVAIDLFYRGINIALIQKVYTEYQTKYAFYAKDRIMKKCATMNYSELENPDVVTLKERAINASDSSYKLLTSIYQIISTILSFLLFSGILVTLHPLIVVFLILSSCVYLNLMKFSREYKHKMKNQNSLVTRKLEYIRSISSDFDYAKEVRLFEMQPMLKRLFQLSYKEHYGIQNSIQKRVLTVEIGNSFLTLLRNGGAYIYLLHKISIGEIGVAQFALYFAVISTVASTITNCVKQFNTLKTHCLNLEDYRHFFDLYSEKETGVTTFQEANNAVSIDLVNVSFRYPSADKYTLKNINLSILPGEKIAIVGANGAGKTTLVKLICGMYQPTEGTILINGIPISEYRQEEYYRVISAVFQHTNFLPLSVGENIGIYDGANYNRDRVIQCLKSAGIWSKIESLSLGIDTKMCKDVVEDAVDFSGGELQKLMLARAIYKDSLLLVLDEPTAALDPIAENEIYLKYNQFTERKTSVYISHRLSSTRFCDRIVFIDDGTILEEGCHEELMAKHGEYAKMFEIQSYYYHDTIEK